MLTLCKRYLKDADLAEEQLLNGFMQVFDKIHQFQGSGSFQGWVRKIMVTTCLGWIRKNRKLYKEVDIDTVDFPSEMESGVDRLQADDLMRVIHQLPQGYNTIFNLFAIEGYTHAEIADQLGISINTSKSQLSRARLYIQKQLASEIDQYQTNRIRNGSEGN
jgi:RNA polymerase sigma-70 factor (ECF subfamily)